jgi:hypothetical protein
MAFYNYSDEQREETSKLLLNIQLHLPWKLARCECEHINSDILGIYSILDMVHHQSHYPDNIIKRLRDGIGKSSYHGGECPYGSMNEGNCHSYGDCTLCIFDHELEKLGLY